MSGMSKSFAMHLLRCLPHELNPRVVYKSMMCNQQQANSRRSLHLYPVFCTFKRTRDSRRMQSEMLMRLLGMTQDQANAVLKDSKGLQSVDASQMESCYNMLKRFDFEQTTLQCHPELLSLLPASIENHALVLLESGFIHLEPRLLRNYTNIARKSISLLKIYGYIGPQANVVKNFLDKLTLPQNIKQSALCGISNIDSENICSLHTYVLRTYITWRLECTPEEIDRILSTYPRLRHKSVAYMEQIIDLLQHKLEFTSAMIKKHGYLIHCPPQLIMRHVANNNMTIGGLQMKEAVHARPKILMTDPENIVRITRLFKEYHIPNEAIQRALEVYTLKSDTVKERLEFLRETPEFNVLIQHPRIIRLIYYQTKAKLRLSYLQSQQMKCASLHILSSPSRIFERHVVEGEDKTKGTETIMFLSKQFKALNSVIRSRLCHHPFWCQIPLVSIDSTLKYLLRSGFNKEHIMFSLPIVLYPQDKIRMELAIMGDRDELKQLPEWKTSTKYHLELCLYFMERETNFSGDAVWPHDNSSNLESEIEIMSPIEKDASETAILYDSV